MALKHFTAKEVAGLRPSTAQRFDDARDKAGIPFSFTCTYRDEKHNAEVGGKVNSAHLRRTAADIWIDDSHELFRALDGLLRAGFPRIGIYFRINDEGSEYIAGLHADDDETLPQEVVWLTERPPKTPLRVA